MSREYEFLIRALGHRVSTLHGFTREEYEIEIRGMPEQTEFKGRCQMALTDIRIRVTLKNGH